MREKTKKRVRPPWEFSKRLAAWCVIIATAAAVASYVLAFRGLDTAEGITTTVFTGCIGYLVSYAAKSAAEKVSRNRHGLDADGTPFGVQANNIETEEMTDGAVDT
ncbi:MAG: hypothetical protein HFF15_01800 [Angelakisella sp.]|jgi:hypothetical protein|nr:hypothetical protein [Angelakisella sp.]